MGELTDSGNPVNAALPLVSVIVPIYNIPAALLERCVASVIAQTYENLEIILVDDGCTLKECLAALDCLALDDSRIEVIHKANGGVSSARNAALASASGKYIVFVDPDDYLPGVDVLSEAVGIGESLDVDIVYGAIAHQYKQEEDVRYFEESVVPVGETLVATDAQIGALFEYFFCIRVPLGSKVPGTLARGPYAKLFRSEVIGGIRFDEKLALAEDALFNALVIARAQKVAFCNKDWYRAVVYKNSASHGVSMTAADVRDICEGLRERYPGFPEQLHGMFAFGLIRAACHDAPFGRGSGGVLAVRAFLRDPWVRNILRQPYIRNYSFSRAELLLFNFQKEGHWILYSCAVWAGALMMRLEGKERAER